MFIHQYFCVNKEHFGNTCISYFWMSIYTFPATQQVIFNTFPLNIVSKEMSDLTNYHIQPMFFSSNCCNCHRSWRSLTNKQHPNEIFLRSETHLCVVTNMQTVFTFQKTNRILLKHKTKASLGITETFLLLQYIHKCIRCCLSNPCSHGLVHWRIWF